ncbi:MAG TPA: hypothetical protein VFI82_07390 [Terriglobales bacterium]|jgi:hypothetical protein|nr:hypothetical protein [Terriglobales bacterium]
MNLRQLYCFLSLLILVSQASAGGPLAVGGPKFGTDGKPFTWDVAAMPIQYRVDTGPLAKLFGGAVTIDNTAGLARVQSMFAIWQNVPTTSIQFQYAGPILATGSFRGGDVVTTDDFNSVYGDCKAGTQNPIVFDADGSIVRDLGLPPDIIGFAAPCKLDSATGHIASGFALLNGEFQDGVSQGTNYELTSHQFDEAITHELGHFAGLDHSQINASVLDTQLPCSTDGLAGLPLMFPVAYCQARTDAGLPILSPDDQAWISKLYPNGSFASSYGTISGIVYFSDGKTAAQGVNVIARRIDDPNTPANESLRIAVSVVSGFLFTGNPGQPITGDNSDGDRNGSRNPQLVGYFEIPVPPGTYTVEVESVRPTFQSGSRVGPLDPPIGSPGPPEFWNVSESAFDLPAGFDTITVVAGQNVANTNFILNGTPARFDQFEDGAVSWLWQTTDPLRMPRKEVRV